MFGRWFAGVMRLAENHHGEVTAWLEQMYNRHRANPRPLWDIVRAALDIREPAAPRWSLALWKTIRSTQAC